MKHKRVKKVRNGAKVRKAAGGAPDTSWLDDLSQGLFWKPAQGKNTVRITGPIVKRMTRWNKPSYDLPTDHGVFSTGSVSFIQPIADYIIKRGRNPHAIIGRTLTFTCKGTEKARKLLDIEIR